MLCGLQLVRRLVQRIVQGGGGGLQSDRFVVYLLVSDIQIHSCWRALLIYRSCVIRSGSVFDKKEYGSLPRLRNTASAGTTLRCKLYT